ncbi:MAG: nitroreductase family protein [Candidatus Lokiarchaeota archaeon]
MDFEKVVYNRRTIRRFKQKPVDIILLKKLIDYARIAPIGINVQALEYIIVQNKTFRDKLFPLVNWARSLPKEQRAPESNRRPMGYIIVLINNNIRKKVFALGAAVENILLGAVNHGLACCWMGSIDRPKIRSLLEIPDNYEIKYVISIGYPDEISVIEPFKDSFKYWKDEDGKMHVPKRELNDILIKVF